MDEVLHVGIDLGTSRSAISASNGERFVVESFVGWPLDMVAKKVLKRDVLIGHEAVANRTMLDLHRPLERGLLKEGSEKDVEAVRELLRHLLRLVGVNGKIDAANVRAVVGVPAAALRTNKQYLRNAMKGIVDSLLIVSEPFAVAYGLDALLHTMIIDIGAGTTDFCVMKGRYPTEEDQRTLTVAGDSIDTQLLKLVQERYPAANVTVYMVREWKEKHSFVGDSRRDGRREGAGERRADGPRHHGGDEGRLRDVCSRRSSRPCSTCCRASSRSSRSACGTTSSSPAAEASSAACPRRWRPRCEGGRRREGALHEGPGVHRVRRRPGLATDAPEGDWEKLTA